MCLSLVFVLSFGRLIKWRYLSTAMEECMAITEACKEAIRLRRLFGEISEEFYISTTFCDSYSATFLIEIQMFHERIKHIDVRYHFVRNVIACGDIIVNIVDINENITDMLTTTLYVAKFEHCLDLIGIYC